MHEHSKMAGKRAIRQETICIYISGATARAEDAVSHTWSGLGETFWQRLVFPGAGNDPLTTSVPLLRVRICRVLKCDLVIEKFVLGEPQAVGWGVVNQKHFRR